MKRIEVIADFHYLDSPKRIGELGYDRIRGNASYSFEYETSWLDKAKIELSADLNGFSGIQHKSGDIFLFLADVLPDRWGRRLIDKRERIIAEKEKRIPHTFNDFDYLVQVDDLSRMGGLKFCMDDEFLGSANNGMPVPPVAGLREFVDIANKYEQSDKNGKMLDEKWLDNVLIQGSSLGGARPKANVIDEDGYLCIAKIPSINDDYDIALWEHFAHNLAKKVGIDAAETRLLRLDGVKYHTMLSRRFDRSDDNRRIHFASAMTLAGLSDGADAESGHGYMDISDIFWGDAGVAEPERELKELFRRIAYNICIGNHDDHFRNHGFLLGERGWKLSPAYDMNPTNYVTQSLLVSPESNESSLNLLIESSDSYMIERAEAVRIVKEVKETMKHWREVATVCGISKTEQGRFARRLDWAVAD